MQFIRDIVRQLAHPRVRGAHRATAPRPLGALGLLGAALAAAAPTAAAQQPASSPSPAASQAASQPPQPAPSPGRPAIRSLGPVVARSAQPFASVGAVRHLPGGRVLVNDVMGRRLVLLDSALTLAAVVADTTSATGNAYGGRMGGLIAYRGDSALFVDAASLSMLVVDPAGKVARVMSVPRAQDAMALASAAFGSPGFDAAGRLVYRAPPMFRRGAPAAGGAPPAPPTPPDTMAVVRVDLATRKTDTVGFVKVPRPNVQVTRDDAGRMRASVEVNPLPVVDEWAVLADGSIAFVRGRDYHVDWVDPNGTRRSSPKIPFDWQRLTDDDKSAFIDSVKAARARIAVNAPPGAPGGGAVPGAGPGGGPGGGPGAGAPMTITMIGPDGGRGGPPGGAPGGGGPAGASMMTPEVSFVSPSQLPDYKPPFFFGSVRADADGNLWIQTIPTRPVAGGPVYDVVNRRGELTDRVQLPAGRTVVGFGVDGVVYLAARDTSATAPGTPPRMTLERARLR